MYEKFSVYFPRLKSHNALLNAQNNVMRVGDVVDEPRRGQSHSAHMKK